MGRNVEAKCRICRRENEKLFLKGEKCYTEKCPFKRRPYAPGQHGKTRMPKNSDYKVRLREKQKARMIYGISERQFENYFNRAIKSKAVTGEKLLEMLERRLDNVVFRTNFAPSRQGARQVVRHGHCMVNEKKVNIPSYQVKLNDIITIKSSSAENIRKNLEKPGEKKVPNWLSLDQSKLQCKVEAIPKREDIEAAIDEMLIVEYYSR